MVKLKKKKKIKCPCFVSLLIHCIVIMIIILGIFITLYHFDLVIYGICHNFVKELIISGLHFFHASFKKLPFSFEIWGIFFL